MTAAETGPPDSPPDSHEGSSAYKPGGDGGTESSGSEVDKDRTAGAKGVNRKVIGFALVALGVINSLFRVKAGIEETAWLNLLLIGAGAVIFFSALRQGRNT